MQAEAARIQLELDDQLRAASQREDERKQAAAELKRVRTECDAKVREALEQLEEAREAERQAREEVERARSEVKRAQVFNYKLQKAVELSDKSSASGGIGATEVGAWLTDRLTRGAECSAEDCGESERGSERGSEGARERALPVVLRLTAIMVASLLDGLHIRLKSHGQAQQCT